MKTIKYSTSGLFSPREAVNGCENDRELPSLLFLWFVKEPNSLNFVPQQNTNWYKSNDCTSVKTIRIEEVHS